MKGGRFSAASRSRTGILKKNMDAQKRSETMNNPKELLGEILVRRGKVTTAQLNEALARQGKERKLIGEIFVAMGVLEEVDIVAALVLQCGVPYIAVNKYAIAPQIITLVPESLAREFTVLPFDKIDHTLNVVMADPLKQEAVQKLAQATGMRIAVFVATKTEIETAINRYFGARAR